MHNPHIDAKAKELETRKRLGPRLSRSPRAPFKPMVDHPRRPRATGAPSQAMRG